MGAGRGKNDKLVRKSFNLCFFFSSFTRIYRGDFNFVLCAENVCACFRASATIKEKGNGRRTPIRNAIKLQRFMVQYKYRQKVRYR